MLCWSMALRSARRHSQSALLDRRLPLMNLNGSGSLAFDTEAGGVPTMHTPFALSSFQPLTGPVGPVGPPPPAAGPEPPVAGPGPLPPVVGPGPLPPVPGAGPVPPVAGE